MTDDEHREWRTGRDFEYLNSLNCMENVAFSLSTVTQKSLHLQRCFCATKQQSLTIVSSCRSFWTLFTQLKFYVLTTETTENENSRFRYFFSFPLLLKLHASIDIWTFKRVGEKEATGGDEKREVKVKKNFFINRRFLFFRSDQLSFWSLYNNNKQIVWILL